MKAQKIKEVARAIRSQSESDTLDGAPGPSRPSGSRGAVRAGGGGSSFNFARAIGLKTAVVRVEKMPDPPVRGKIPPSPTLQISDVRPSLSAPLEERRAWANEEGERRVREEFPLASPNPKLSHEEGARIWRRKEDIRRGPYAEVRVPYPGDDDEEWEEDDEDDDDDDVMIIDPPTPERVTDPTGAVRPTSEGLMDTGSEMGSLEGTDEASPSDTQSLPGCAPARRDNFGNYDVSADTQPWPVSRESLRLDKEDLDRRCSNIGALTVSSPAEARPEVPVPEERALETLPGGVLEGNALSPEDLEILQGLGADVPIPASPPPTRGRGRPQTTGAWRKKQEERRRWAEKEAQRLGLPPPQTAREEGRARSDRMNRAAQRVEELVRDNATMPVLELAARGLEQSTTIGELVDCSMNIRGDIKGRLRRANHALRAVLASLAARAREAPPTEQAAELAELRGQLRVSEVEVLGLKAQIERLRAEVEALKAAGGVGRDPTPLSRPTRVTGTQTSPVPASPPPCEPPSAPALVSSPPPPPSAMSPALPREGTDGVRDVGASTVARSRGRGKKSGGMGGVRSLPPCGPQQPLETGASLPGPKTMGPKRVQPPPPSTAASWAEVVKRGAKKKRRGAAADAAPPPPPSNVTDRPVRARPSPSSTGGGEGRKGSRRENSRRCPAVVLACPEGTYARTLALASANIKLRELGVSQLRPKVAMTGSMILELPGADDSKAEALASRLREVLAPMEGVRVTRPVKTAELRVRDLVDSATPEEISEAVAEVGSCGPSDVTVGPIRRAPNGLSTAWVRCPLAAARKVAQGSRIQVGIFSARVELLAMRPLQCFKCLQRGHVQRLCPSAADRRRCCHRCGVEGHVARGCTAQPKCPVCVAAGRPAGHRVGGPSCPAPSRRGAWSRLADPPSRPAAGEERPLEEARPSNASSPSMVVEEERAGKRKRRGAKAPRSAATAGQRGDDVRAGERGEGSQEQATADTSAASATSPSERSPPAKRGAGHAAKGATLPHAPSDASPSVVPEPLALPTSSSPPHKRTTSWSFKGWLERRKELSSKESSEAPTAAREGEEGTD